jgi:copper homeostasis protein
MTQPILEICIESVDSAIAAHRGGADRVELCSAIPLGGVTPSAGLIASVRAAVPIDVFVLIRPHAGDFTYSASEFEVMRQDILRARDLGANGVVFGLLRPDASVDVDRTSELIALARPMKVTFHRAFDVAADLPSSLEDVITCGADRVLTSGAQPSGMAGADTIATLVQQAGNRITILGGGGLRASSVRAFVNTTGVREVHTSLRSAPPASPNAQKHHLIFGAGAVAASPYTVTAEDVRTFRTALQHP